MEELRDSDVDVEVQMHRREGESISEWVDRTSKITGSKPRFNFWDWLLRIILIVKIKIWF